MIPAIVLSAKTMALGVVRALGMMGVPVIVVHYDPQDIAQHSKYVVEAVPAPDPVIYEMQFLQILINLAERWPQSVVMPCSDETLVVTAQYKDTLARHFHVACPDYASVQQVIEKHQTYPAAEAAGVPVPKTLLPRSIDDVEDFSCRVVYPCLIKPSQSHLFVAHFRVKMFIADNAAALLEGYRKAAAVGLEVMIQEYIPGPDQQVVNYNVYALNGNSLLEFTAEHVRNAPPCYGSPRVALSKSFDGLLEVGRDLMRGLNYTGFACVEFKFDQRDSQFKLMEVNGRHNLSTLLAVKCGINFPWLEYRHHAYGELPEPREFKAGVYWIDFLRDLNYSARHFMREGIRFSEYWRPYQEPHVWAVMASNDPQPFLNKVKKRTADILCSGFKRLPAKKSSKALPD